MEVLRIIKNLIFVPKCAACRDRLSPIPEDSASCYGKICLCERCRAKWESAKATPCPRCSNTAENCTCSPSFFKGIQPNIPALCFYNSEENEVQSRIIYSMKHKNNGELFGFMALEVLPPLTRTLSKMGISAEDCIFTWVPRTKAAINKDGFDQGKELCIALSSSFKKVALPVFVRIKGDEQKKLNMRERKQNAEKTIFLNRKMKGFPKAYERSDIADFCKGKNFIIIDDIMTTGTTLQHATELLIAEGAENVVTVCIAKSNLK